MKLKVFTLRYDSAAARFDDRELVEFLADRIVLSVHEHFFVHEQTPTWALLVTYRDAGPLPRERPDTAPDWRADLTGEERAIYDAVRRWRNDRARRDGRPPYVLLTNRQLADLARRRPTTLAALREIEGVGDAKLDRFGQELVVVIQAAAAGGVAGPAVAAGVGAERATTPPGEPGAS